MRIPMVGRIVWPWSCQAPRYLKRTPKRLRTSELAFVVMCRLRSAGRHARSEEEHRHIPCVLYGCCTNPFAAGRLHTSGLSPSSSVSATRSRAWNPRKSEYRGWMLGEGLRGWWGRVPSHGATVTGSAGSSSDLACAVRRGGGNESATWRMTDDPVSNVALPSP